MKRKRRKKPTPLRLRKSDLKELREVIGETIHTAFRKGGGATSDQVWHRIDKMSPDEWSSVCEWIVWALGYTFPARGGKA